MIKRNFTVSPEGDIIDDRPEFSGPSRSQKKRDAKSIFELGASLVTLKPAELKRLALDEELLEAVLLCAEMKRTARARQLRRIAKLLRAPEREHLLQALRESKWRS